MKALLDQESLPATVLLAAFCVLTAIVNPEFLSVGTLFDLARSAIVPGIMALGVLLVMVSGGIDVSFTAIAAFAMYGAVRIVVAFGLGDHLVWVFVFGALIGAALGGINAFFIGTLRLPTLIVTLGTLSLFHGVLLTVLGTAEITSLPNALARFGTGNLVSISASDGTLYQLSTAFIVLVVAAVAVAFLLNRLVVGRCIYALGGSQVSAERIGISVAAMQYLVYCLVGGLSGIAGVVQAATTRTANPFDLVGQELFVIAAVVLGGVRITGGRGSVAGTLIGVSFVALMSNNLILWGVPSTWQNIVLGVLILFCVGISALRGRMAGLST